MNLKNISLMVNLLTLLPITSAFAQTDIQALQHAMKAMSASNKVTSAVTQQATKQALGGAAGATLRNAGFALTTVSLPPLKGVGKMTTLPAMAYKEYMAVRVTAPFEVQGAYHSMVKDFRANHPDLAKVLEQQGILFTMTGPNSIRVTTDGFLWRDLDLGGLQESMTFVNAVKKGHFVSIAESGKISYSIKSNSPTFWTGKMQIQSGEFYKVRTLDHRMGLLKERMEEGQNLVFRPYEIKSTDLLKDIFHTSYLVKYHKLGYPDDIKTAVVNMDDIVYATEKKIPIVESISSKGKAPSLVEDVAEVDLFAYYKMGVSYRSVNPVQVHAQGVAKEYSALNLKGEKNFTGEARHKATLVNEDLVAVLEDGVRIIPASDKFVTKETLQSAEPLSSITLAKPNMLVTNREGNIVHQAEGVVPYFPVVRANASTSFKVDEVLAASADITQWLQKYARLRGIVGQPAEVVAYIQYTADGIPVAYIVEKGMGDGVFKVTPLEKIKQAWQEKILD